MGFAQSPDTSSGHNTYNNESDYIVAQQNMHASSRVGREQEKLLNFFEGYIRDIDWVDLPNSNTSWEPYQKYLALILLQEKYKDLKNRYAPKDEPTDAWLEIINASEEITVYFGSQQHHPSFKPKQNIYLNYFDVFFEDLKQEYRDFDFDPYEFIRKH